jgi:imidazole glycerol-phosphate synthase subunit HisF
MLTRRIIPCLDVKDGRVVKGKQFSSLMDVDDPATLGRFYSEQGADELVFYDITASSDQRQISLDFVERVAREVNIPFCVGGGVESIDDFTRILRKGADKISINSGAVKNPKLIAEASRKFGAQCVVLSIDAKRNHEGSWSVYVKGGREKTNLDAIAWAIEGVRLGAGEIVVNSIDSDGMKQGYDIELLSAITGAVNVPVIASGGAGLMVHFEEAIKKANVDGILAASVFHYKEIEINDLKQYLFEKGIAVRR